MGPCSTKKDFQAQNDPAKPSGQQDQTGANPQGASASPTNDPGRPNVKKSGFRDIKTLTAEEKQKMKYSPQNIICEPRSISRALMVNSQAIQFRTEQPNIQLRSPVIGAQF